MYAYIIYVYNVKLLILWLFTNNKVLEMIHENN